MREHGLRIGFVPQLLIDHCVLKYKYTMLWHIKSAYASSRDYTRIVRHKKFNSIFYFKGLRILLIDIVKGIKFFIRFFCDKNYTFQQAFFEYFRQVAKSFGFLAAILSKKI